MPRYKYNLSHEHKTTLDMGQLGVLSCVEVLPGDTFVGSTSLLCRVSALARPVMHNVELRTDTFFVPNRIVFDSWEKFITGEETLQLPGFPVDENNEQLARQMGIGRAIGAQNFVNDLPFRAYRKIWNEFYRDQDLQEEMEVSSAALVEPEKHGLLRACWRRDYFTAARPNPTQNGGSVDLNLSGEVPVDGIYVPAPPNASWATRDDLMGNYPVSNRSGTVETPLVDQDPNRVDNINVFTDLSKGSGTLDLDELRRVVGVQKVLEARARYGDRYIDVLRHYGINPSDGRLQRPEWLGGSSETVNFSEVLATAEGANTAVGDLAGHGMSGLKSKRYRKTFEEHGYCITLFTARPRGVYMGSTPRHFYRNDPLDYWQPELEFQPWQEIQSREIDPNGNTEPWGYVPRYEEYKHQPSYVSGAFLDIDSDWHMARDLVSPVLNDSFVECTPTDRIYNDANVAELQISAYNKITADRIVTDKPGEQVTI